jgi:uncharacterized membrane protein YfcA
VAKVLTSALLATFIGLALGLFGGGGSVLAVPMLIYVAGLSDKSAIATSLVLVSVTSLVALSSHAFAKNVEWRGAIAFAPSAMIGAYVGALFAARLPGALLVGLFAVVMVMTAGSMWRKGDAKPEPHPHGRHSVLAVSSLGAAVGLLTGLVGAGGGFLVVPALALLLGMPLGRAIGTSLVVIAANSAAALLGYASDVSIDFRLAAVITLTASLGAIVGSKLVRRIDTRLLRKGFAVLILTMGLMMLLRAVRSGMA